MNKNRLMFLMLIFVITIVSLLMAETGTVTVRNDLEGEDGGSVGIAIYPSTFYTIYSSPKNYSANVNSSLNLKAYDNQNVDGKVWFFNDTEYQARKSEWRWRNPQTGDGGRSASTAEFTSADVGWYDNTIEEVAYLRTVDYTDSGTMSSDELWWTPATLIGNVTVANGVILTLMSSGSINLNGYSIKCQGTGKIVKNGTISNYSCYVMEGSDYKAFYPTSLNADISVPTGKTLTCAATTTLNGHYIASTGGTITIDGGVTVTPNIQIKHSGTLKALYPRHRHFHSNGQNPGINLGFGFNDEW